jgi:hypothetical protein
MILLLWTSIPLSSRSFGSLTPVFVVVYSYHYHDEPTARRCCLFWPQHLEVLCSSIPTPSFLNPGGAVTSNKIFLEVPTSENSNQLEHI